MKRREFLKGAAGMGVAGAALGATQEPLRGKRGNVVLVVSDDHDPPRW